MKKIFTLVLVSAFILIGCGENKKNEKTSVALVKLESKKMGSLKIAFYNQDTLKSQFKFYSEQDAAMQKKQLAFQNEVEKMTREYQDFLASYDGQAKEGLLSQVQIQGIQQKAAEKEQRIMKYQQENGERLEKETFDRLEVIGKKLEVYSRQFCEENKIDILLTHAKGGQLAYITPSMDVTDNFIQFLNEHEDEIAKDMGKK
jgi:Skp family chaperone for outer membrane proteins